jgi:hypothetical protein
MRWVTECPWSRTARDATVARLPWVTGGSTTRRASRRRLRCQSRALDRHARRGHTDYDRRDRQAPQAPRGEPQPAARLYPRPHPGHSGGRSEGTRRAHRSSVPRCGLARSHARASTEWSRSYAGTPCARHRRAPRMDAVAGTAMELGRPPTQAVVMSRPRYAGAQEPACRRRCSSVAPRGRRSRNAQPMLEGSPGRSRKRAAGRLRTEVSRASECYRAMRPAGGYTCRAEPTTAWRARSHPYRL